jgi:HK97 family phage portal protein
MGLIQQIKAFISPTGEVAQNDLPIPVTELWNKHNFTPIVNWRGAYQMWKANPVAVACTLTYSLMMPEAQIGVITANGYDFESPIVGMLTRNQWRVTFGEIMTILCIGGNAYGYKLRNASGAIIGMRWYSDKNFAPVNDGYGDVEHYLYYDGQVAYTVRKEDVVHIQGFWYDPEKTLGGGSPVELAAQSIEGYNEATSTVFNIHKNDAMPKTIVVYDEELTPDQVALAERSFKRKYGGDRRGSVGIMWGVKDVKRLALDWNELGLSDTFGQYETRICGAYKVHPIIAGTHMGLSSATYSNFEQASKDFTNMVRVPFWNMIADQINAQLAIPEYGVQLGFDLSTVQALAGETIAMEAVSTDNDSDVDDDSNVDDSPETLSLGGGVSSDKYFHKNYSVTVGPETKAWLHHPDSQVYAKAYDDLLNKQSEKIAKEWGRVLDDLYDTITADVKALRIETKIDDQFSLDVWEKNFVEGTEDSRTELTEIVLALAQEEVDAEGEFTRGREAGITESANKIADSVGTIRTDIQTLLRQNAGVGEEELARLLKEKFSDLKVSRANAIARTTATATTGTVQKSVWDELGGIRRSWVALSGARDEHMAAHDQLEGEKAGPGLFLVGGETTPYPAGDGLSAWNAVNCRCFTRARQA